MWYESKNIAEIVEDSTAFCPNTFNECATQGVHIADRLWFIMIYCISFNLHDKFLALS